MSEKISLDSSALPHQVGCDVGILPENMRCVAADTLCRVLELRHALPACPPCRWLRHRSLAPLLRRCQRHRTSEPYAPAVSAHRPSFAAGDGCRRGPLVCGTAAWRTLRVPHDASGRLSPAGHPHLLAAGASRVLNRLCVHKDCTSLRRPGPRKDDVSFIQ